MDAAWEGLGSDAFTPIWQQHEQQFKQLFQLMQQYSMAIKAAAARYRDAEQRIQTVVRTGHN